MDVSAALQILAPYVEREINLIFSSKREAAETLLSKLKKIQEGLQDAERQAVTDLNVKTWLKELEDVMYEMDDVLDKWKTKKLQLQIAQSSEDASDFREKVRSLFMSLCLCFKFNVVEHRKIMLEMKAPIQKLDRILQEKEIYSFVPNKIDTSQDFKQGESTSFVDKSDIHGRDFEKDRLVEMLLSKGKENGIQVISIVGIGGVGKTTLAQLVYSDPKVEEHFDLKAWVSVPDPFDASRIAKTILENVRPSSTGASFLETLGQKEVGNSSSSASTLEALGQRIEAVVSKKKFLLVLDNVWTEDQTKWEPLKNLLVSAQVCGVLVTTRSEIVARMMGTTQLERLGLLSDSDCATILNKIALVGKSEEHEKLRDIGLEIAKKCNGLPLAARTIGSMLASRFTLQEWRDVLESPFWRYEDEMSDIFRLLRLSYVDLSPTLRCCFLSCVLCSKGSTFDAVELIKIWMSQGYISSSATWAEVESKGMEIIQKLYMRSFFQEVIRSDDFDGGIICKMHDVMREFASYLSRTEHYFIRENKTHNMPIESIERTRNFCVRSGCLEGLPSNFIRLLKCDRVLCLRDCGLDELSKEVGKLIHLRYLDLSWNPIKKLPETMCDLYNLQTLDLQGCPALSRLPHGIGRLKNLRHLLLSDPYLLNFRGYHFIEYPRGLEKLTGLWTLNVFRATRESVGYLRNLNQLSRRLHIFVEGLNEVVDAEKANLKGKIHMKELTLRFDRNVSMDVIEATVPPPQIQTLFIIVGGNKQLPSWITTTCVNNLIKLGISNSGDCSYLPSLGKLPLLEHLSLGCMAFTSLSRFDFLGIIPQGGTTSTAVAEGGGFPKLKILDFWICRQWEEWEDVEAAATYSVPILPCLQKLEFTKCPNLKALPINLLLHVAPSLHNLTISNCECLESRYHKEFGADRDKISHIPDIHIWGDKTKEMDNA